MTKQMKEEDIYYQTWNRDDKKTFVHAIEEMTELIKAICKNIEGRGSEEDIAKEAADVIVTVGVIAHISFSEFKKKKEICLNTLIEKLK